MRNKLTVDPRVLKSRAFKAKRLSLKQNKTNRKFLNGKLRTAIDLTMMTNDRQNIVYF